MENKETMDKIPTAEGVVKMFDKKKIYMPDDTWKHTDETLEEMLLYFVNMHLTKQAEVIAEKAEIECLDYDHVIVDKQSILQASEEYKQTIK